MGSSPEEAMPELLLGGAMPSAQDGKTLVFTGLASRSLSSPLQLGCSQILRGKNRVGPRKGTAPDLCLDTPDGL